MTRHLEVTRDIAASPAKVYAAISDIARMGEWSPECYSCEWLEAATEAAVGARFAGHNRNNGKEWTTEALITAAEPGVRFAFDCLFGDFHFASWAYEFEAIDDGCRVTEIWDDHRPDEMRNKKSAISGVEDRVESNRQSMAATLEQIATAVE